jgi:ssDNA-binding Zn-finger/Zn-ribbon topoisomerase 1
MSRIQKEMLIYGEGDNCPSCKSTDLGGNGVLKKRKGTYGEFLGCSNYPYCQFTNKPNRGQRSDSYQKKLETDQKIRLAKFPKKNIKTIEI